MAIALPRRSGPLTILTVVLLSTSASADYGRYFLSPADSSIVFSYGGTGGGGMPTQFDKTIMCDTTTVGQIRFDYDTYLQKPDGTTSGGAALAGGFYIDPNIQVATGHHLGWVQTVNATIAGANDWGIDPASKTAGTFPDAKPTNPEYPNQTVPTSPANPGPPTVAFQDFPNRLFADGNQSWLGELALVCFNDTPDAMGRIEGDVIFSFLWGFGVTTMPNAITSDPPSLLGPATATFLNTLNSYYDGTPPNPPTDGRVSNKYVFSNGCDGCFKSVPEPSSVILVLIGMVGVRFRATHRRAA